MDRLTLILVIACLVGATCLAAMATVDALGVFRESAKAGVEKQMDTLQATLKERQYDPDRVTSIEQMVVEAQSAGITDQDNTDFAALMSSIETNVTQPVLKTSAPTFLTANVAEVNPYYSGNDTSTTLTASTNVAAGYTSRLLHIHMGANVVHFAMTVDFTTPDVLEDPSLVSVTYPMPVPSSLAGVVPVAGPVTCKDATDARVGEGTNAYNYDSDVITSSATVSGLTTSTSYTLYAVGVYATATLT